MGKDTNRIGGKNIYSWPFPSLLKHLLLKTSNRLWKSKAYGRDRMPKSRLNFKGVWCNSISATWWLVFNIRLRKENVMGPTHAFLSFTHTYTLREGFGIKPWKRCSRRQLQVGPEASHSSWVSRKVITGEVTKGRSRDSNERVLP